MALRGPLLGAALGAFIMVWIFGVEEVVVWDHDGRSYTPYFNTLRERAKYYHNLDIEMAKDGLPDKVWRTCAFPLQEIDRKAPEGQLILMILGGLLGALIAVVVIRWDRGAEGAVGLSILLAVTGAIWMFGMFRVGKGQHFEIEEHFVGWVRPVPRARTPDEVRRWEDYVHEGSIDAAKDRQADKLWRDYAGPWSDMDRLALEGKLFLMLVGGMVGSAAGYGVCLIDRAFLRRLELQRQKMAFIQESGGQLEP